MATKETILDRVRQLLDKADSTTFPAEAQALREKADELMLKYAIDEFELRIKNFQQRETPELYQFPICGPKDHLGWQLLDLASTCARHARCKLVYSGKPQWGMTAKLVGFPADVRYAEMLFTSLRVQMSLDLEPKPDPSLTMLENLAMLKEAGLKWRRIAELLDLPWDDTKPGGGMDLATDYTKFCKATNRDRLYTAPQVYQKNFAAGFVNKVSNRLYEMREKTAATVDKDTMALVLHDRSAEIDVAFGQYFPKLGKGAFVQMKYDTAARNRGSDAGAKADLSIGRNVRGSSRKQLN